MLYVSILTSDRNLDPELWAVIWQANMPDDLTLHNAYNMAGNKRLFIWETDSVNGLQFMDNFNHIGELVTYPVFDRSDGWKAAFAGDIETFRDVQHKNMSKRNILPDRAEQHINSAIELRKGALESPTREAARRHAREWIAAREKASDNS